MLIFFSPAAVQLHWLITFSCPLWTEQITTLLSVFLSQRWQKSSLIHWNMYLM